MPQENSHQPSPAHDTSNDLERVVLNRLRDKVGIIPPVCTLHREISDGTAVLCIDCGSFEQVLPELQVQGDRLLRAAAHLGLAHHLIFRLGHKIKGWMSDPLE